MTEATDVVVSVVIPCFNQARYLSECLKSLLAQDISGWEAIVVDDASTDGGPEYLAAELDDHRIRTVRHERNRGLGAARNTGFKLARGDLFLPLDSDDELLPEFLSRTTRVLERSPSVDCVFTDFQLFGASDEIWRNSAKHSLSDMLDGQWIPGPGTLMRRSVWDRVGGYAEVQALAGNEDWDFWIGALSAGASPAHVPAPLYRYRRHAESMSVWMPSVEYTQRKCIYLRHRKVFDHHGAGGRFKAVGYVNSAAFAWRAGHPAHAAGLLARGLAIRGGARPVISAVTNAVLQHARRIAPAAPSENP
jgi:glycosyltransferase involved in cell wall biosynthesis